MKTLSLFILAGAALLTPICAQAQSLDEGNRAFAAGRFEESTVSYANVIALHGYSAPALFDLGNSYYSEGNFAQAILAYKRAQWLAPNDPDITANLQLAEKKAGLPVSEPRLRENYTNILSPSGWAWLGCAAWTLLCVTLFARVILLQRRSLFNLTGLACALILCTSIAAMVISSSELQQAVVTDKNASALISPFPAAQPVFSPTPGDTVAVQKTYGDYLLVSDSTGRSGWVSKAQISPIIEH